MAATGTSRLSVRPAHVLQELPPRYRWEFTRRHPFYLQLANKFQMVSLSRLNAEQKEAYHDQLRFPLQLLGVSTDPPPPSLSFDQLRKEDRILDIWQEGAIAPLTFRSMAMALLALDAKTKMKIAEALRFAADPEPYSQFVAMSALSREPAGVLDSNPGALIVGINIHAPGKAAVEALRKLMVEEKKRRRLRQNRRRFDKLGEKLEVWDLREGWTGHNYKVDAEKSFGDIAAHLKKRTSSVVTQYRDAFYAITGYDYSFDNWLTLFQFEKLQTAAGGMLALRRRRSRSGDGREELVAPAESPTSAAEPAEAQWNEAAADTIETREMVRDIVRLIEKGLNNEAIIEQLQLKSDQLVKLLRSHRADAS